MKQALLIVGILIFAVLMLLRPFMPFWLDMVFIGLSIIVILVGLALKNKDRS